MPAKSLSNPNDRAELLTRIERVRPDTPRKWGRMTAPQMICHLTDAFRGIMGERPSPSPAAAFPRWKQRLIKLVAIHSPLPWPHGTPTLPHIDSERGGTRPRAFDADVAELVQAFERFAAGHGTRGPHFAFGPLSAEEWARWGYRHVDHHLRQFGV